MSENRTSCCHLKIKHCCCLEIQYGGLFNFMFFRSFRSLVAFCELINKGFLTYKVYYFARMLALDGEVGIEMPNCLLETRLQSCTTQRLGGILEMVNTRKAHQRRLTSLRLHRKLATVFCRDANMTSFPICLTSANSFLIRSVMF